MVNFVSTEIPETLSGDITNSFPKFHGDWMYSFRIHKNRHTDRHTFIFIYKDHIYTYAYTIFKAKAQSLFSKFTISGETFSLYMLHIFLYL